MAKMDNFKIHNEGKNLINNNKNDNFDSSNYDNNPQKNYFIDNKDNIKNDDLKKVNNKGSISISERSPTILTKSKEKNIISSKQLKSEINNYNNYNNNINKNTSTNKKENILTSSFVFYKENKCISKFKIIYSSKQKYISIILLIYSLILFLLSIFDLMNKIQQKRDNYLLSNLVIFIFEIICSSLIILFHIFYFFINIGNNYIVFLIMSIIIFVFSLLYIIIYVKKKVRLLEIILYMIYNLFLVLINLIYLFMSYNLDKENNKVQQNIEDIMNFSLRNEKSPDFGKNSNKEKNKDHKIKAIALVEEEK